MLPSRMVTMRWANSAMSGSWVTTTMVLPLFVEVVEEGHDLVAGFGVEVSGGLVCEDDGGVVDQGAGDGDALALAARELVGLCIMRAPRLTDSSDLFGAGDALVGGCAVVDEGQLDVVQGGGAGEQVEGLEDEADFFIADAGDLVVVEGEETSWPLSQ